MCLVDADVMSEVRKCTKANKGGVKFFRQAAKNDTALYLSAVTIGELRRGIGWIRHRGDAVRAQRLDDWLTLILSAI